MSSKTKRRSEIVKMPIKLQHPLRDAPRIDEELRPKIGFPPGNR